MEIFRRHPLTTCNPMATVRRMVKKTTAPGEAIIRAAIAEAGSISGAAITLGVSRQTLHRWLRDLAIKVERRSQAA